ncbi:putative zinc protease YmfH [Weizmannia acidilactici]|uniref:Zinc protease YmfH n=1 Tax=Weizmannia acidilactici TaxID=2607726 RepID=A0A5J4JB50_9BACI|nr:pitrilysin family protein [Weizmannia acidilactici]GER65689.1 putative zinc protease YmfH [Weizmannia acidilactici]GER68981.1 putative zinc protease YmfH [Weizmannia acidilactici]GER72046.1 putative zinc protease YmfH [Weizmannia acidilactici]
MDTQRFSQLDETLYFETLDNGLKVYILPKQGFNKTFVTFTTKYGSVDNEFVPLGKNEFVRVPDGIAHFLEHKMFEKEDGDVFQQFSRQGASANAFTSFNRTAYLFSSTDQVMKNLETLVDMVQTPYFTEQMVEKEKGIIGQEIMMYNDNPDWRLYYGVIENLYKNHPVKIDIAGTVESIAKITAEQLYECYRTFYHPSNMLLLAVGNVSPEEVISFLKKNQEKKKYEKVPEIKRRFPEEPIEAAKKEQKMHMNVQIPKCLVGMKALHTSQSGTEMLKNELTVNLMLDMLFGRSSEAYSGLYNDGLIDTSFSFDYSQEQGFGFAMAGGDTENPDLLAERLHDVMFAAKEGKVLTEEGLERTKKKKIGAFLRQLNSPEFIANQFTRYAFNGMNLFDVVPVLEQIQFNDLRKTAEQFFGEDRFTVCQVLPK